MNSDDEDFNDIYGDESTSTTTVVENKDEAKKDSGAENSLSTAKVSTSNTTSSLDQLAALQALSSNLNQVSTPNSSNNNNNYENSSDNKSNSNNNNDNSENRGDSSSTSNDKASAPAEMSWEQLQQTMSQFQPQSSGGAQQSSSMGPVKADLSRDICKMFIGGLNWETTEDTLRDYFSKYGKVIDLKIMKDTNTGRSRGFGFLTFDEPTSVDEVVKTQHILDGKVIDPKRAIPREEQDKTGKIFVGGIGADVRPKEFEEFFAQWGTIIDAQLMLDKDTGRSRGFGFVTYDSPDAVDRVCQNKFIDFKGKKIEIKRAEPRHMQKQQQGHEGSAQSPPGGANPMAQMYQNPMMGGFNPMFNPQAMAEYYQKMQEYYQQMQQQTGMDYSQMFQQQMQQMSMMMPGYNMPGAGNPGSSSSDAGTPNQGEEGNSNSNSTSNVQTIGGESSESKVGGSGESSDSGENKLQINLPRGPRGPSSSADQGSHSYGQRDRDRDYHYRGGNRNGYRGGNGGGYRGRGGYNRRNNGYHPYNR